jgi:cyclopropane-fatty-acyl-phospholipid synthase
MQPPLLQRWIDRWADEAGVALALRLPDGHERRAGGGEPRFTLVFRTDAAVQLAALRGHMGLLEAYFDGSLDLEGDLGAALAAGLAADLDPKFDFVTRMENEWHELRHGNRSARHAKSNAEAHYGLPEAFYRLWLDEPLKMYTCAYWSSVGPDGGPGDGAAALSLEQAQRNKIDHVARKIRLAHGERVLDIGCGFGGFMFRAAEVFDVDVVGVNTTVEQVRWVREQIHARGLERRLQVVEADFREPQGVFDKVVSIGVLEHAGRDALADVVRAHAEQLAPGGLAMLHFIGHLGPHETELFIRKYVFPGGWIPALSDVLVACERCGLEVLDVENLRRHYALTLDEWARRFEAHWGRIQALDALRFSERFRRVWRVYLVACAELFRSPKGYTHLFQVTVSKGNVTRAGYPMSRAFLYA